jgi:hypothetical protein
MKCQQCGAEVDCGTWIIIGIITGGIIALIPMFTYIFIMG